MKIPQLSSIIEGLLFAAGDEGLDVKQLSDIVQTDGSTLEKALLHLKEQLKKEGRGIQIVEVAGTYQLATLPEHVEYFERMAYAPSRTTLSQASLETLSIIVYKQPITRIEIEEIRGVSCDRALHTLVAKELIFEVGRAEAIGRPILYGTTKRFLDHFGLNSLADLPESISFEKEYDLEAETEMLFKKLNDRQMTIDDVEAN